MDEMPLSSYDSTIEQVKRRDSNVTDSIGDNTKYFRIPTISATANVSDLFKVWIFQLFQLLNVVIYE